MMTNTSAEAMNAQIRRTLENALEVLRVYCLDPEIPQVEAARAWLESLPAEQWQPVDRVSLADIIQGMDDDGLVIITFRDGMRLCRKVTT
jgi:hypothetical protein